ncbi:hypothetical protein E2C01_098608 [Portunus trituberculatus]|uniref:Uncharacterized protein n=1 Tax=Portunus trituberculatus TaxID=210409 RepID=A0A5B7KEK9_PORTR|nr:hypothetical protein [Portunus trituberculatus]
MQEILGHHLTPAMTADSCHSSPSPSSLGSREGPGDECLKVDSKLAGVDDLRDAGGDKLEDELCCLANQP